MKKRKKGFCLKTKSFSLNYFSFGFSLNNLGKSYWKFIESIGKVCFGGLQDILNF